MSMNVFGCQVSHSLNTGLHYASMYPGYSKCALQYHNKPSTASISL